MTSPRRAASFLGVLAILGFHLQPHVARAAGPNSPPNDDFASAELLSGAVGSTSGSNLGATAEPGEPANNGATVWYRWVAPSTAAYVFRTTGSGFDTVLCAYTGEQVAALTVVNCNDDGLGEGQQSRLEFFAAMGATYYLRVDGFGASRGTLILRWGLVGSGAVEVRLNRIVYTPGSLLTATVSGVPASITPHALRLIVAAGSNDLEVVPLIATAEAGVYVTANPLPVEKAAAPGQFVALDGTLTLVANEMFVVMVFPYDNDNGQITAPPEADPLYAYLAADFGLMEDPAFAIGLAEVRPEIAMSSDEINIPPGGKRIGTIGAADGLVLQVPLDEVVLYARSPEQLSQFLQETHGTVLGQASYSQNPNDPSRVYLVRVDPSVADVAHAPQMRALLGEQETLLVSSPETLQIYTLAMQAGLDGFVVGLNPRLQLMGAPKVQDDGAWSVGHLDALDPASTDAAVTSFADARFNLSDCWAFTALWDADSRTIPVGFLDMGFAPNWDFRGYDPTKPNLGIFQRDLEGGTTSAVGPPTVGASFFGSKVWHGNGVVTTAGGVLNNGWGSFGTGGQVVTPMLYKMGLKSYAFEMGKGIALATDDGAAIVNISAGYPCRIKTYIVPDIYLCSPAGRATLCTELSIVFVPAIAAACLNPFIAVYSCPLAVTAAATAVAACYATVLAGDPRGPLKDGVDYALAHGVPVVSVSGNRQTEESLGALCKLIRCGAQDVSDFEIVPGTFPGVLCVGAANNVAPYENREFYGDRVDVWAPVFTTYFGPPTTDAVTGPDEQVRSDRFGGTSAAAPYISGIVAMMQAINPTLDPRSPGLSATEKAAIPGRIRTLLVSNALPASSLPADPTGQRRNLVNAFQALRAAAPAAIRAFDAPAYDFSLGFDETDVANDDTPKSATPIDADATGHWRGTILTLPEGGPPGKGKTFKDVDWYAWRTPAAPGVYTGGRIQVRFPAGFGQIRVNDEEGTKIVIPGETEEVREFAIPPTFEGCTNYLKVSGFGLADNVYLLSSFKAMRKDLTLEADVYDRIETNPLGFANNDSPLHAVPLGGGDPRFPDWVTTEQTVLYTNKQILVTGLTLHAKADEDWFRVAPPPGEDVTGCTACFSSLKVEATDGVTIMLHYEKPDSSGWSVITSGDGEIERGCADVSGRFPVFVHLLSGTCAPMVYDLKITWTTESKTGCRILYESPIADRNRHWNWYVTDPPWSDPLSFPDPFKGPGSYPSDGAGRILAPIYSSINWRGNSPFHLEVRVPLGSSIRAKLMDQNGQVLAHAATPDLIPSGAAPAPAGAANEPLPSPATSSGQGLWNLDLVLLQLPPDIYVLALSESQYNTPVDVLLPRDAIGDARVSLEDLLAPGFVPGDLDGDGFLTQADMQLAGLFASQQANPTPEQLIHGDANGNGVMDPDDLQRLQEALAGTRDLYAEWPAPIFRFPLTRSALEIDRDGDGLPDWWEYSFGLDPHNPADAALDSDNDGASNLAEYLAGTNPRDASDRLQIQAIHGAGGQFLIHFQAVANRSYTVERRPGLGAGAWNPLIEIDTQPFFRTIDVSDQAGGQQFYRLGTPASP